MNLIHYADMIAIPFFALLIYYFYKINHKSKLEYVLLLFSIGGLVMDLLFTYEFLCK